MPVKEGGRDDPIFATQVNTARWVLVAIFFGVPLSIGLVGAIQKRRHPSLERSSEPDDFVNDAHPYIKGRWSDNFRRLR